MRPGQAKGPSTSNGSGGGGSGTVTSTFTAGNIPLASSSTNLGNSALAQAAGVVTVTADLTVTGVNTLGDLAGVGTRMVVASSTGVLSTQSIPAGAALANPTGTVGLAAVNGVLTSGMRSDGAPALSQAIAPTWSAVHTFTLQPIFSSVTASTAAAFDASKGLISVTNTGTGNNVLSASPTLTGTIVAASQTLSGSLTIGTTLGVTGVATFTAQPIFSSVTASTAAAFDASKGLISVTNTGTGNNVLSASPTLTGTIVAASQTLSGSLTVGTTLGVTGVVTLTDLAGSGTRMVVASAAGVLSTQSIPAGASLADPTGTIGLTAVNGVLTSGMRSDGAPALSQAIAPTWSAVHTFTLQPIFSSVTASTAAAFDASKGLVSVTNTGTGNNVLSASPTLTGTIGAASQTLSGSLTVGTTLGVTGVATFTAQPIFSSVTASTAAAFDASKGLVSVTNTGTGNNVLSASPTLTGTVIAAAATLSGVLTLNATGSGTSSALFMSAAAPAITWVVTGAGTNEKVWDLAFTNTTMLFRTRTDAHGTGVDWLRLTRSGTTVTSARLEVSDVGTSTILVCNGSSNLVGSASSNGSIGTINAYVALNSLGLFTHSASISTFVTLSIASNLVAVDASLADDFELTLTANATISNPTNPATGRIIRFRVRQGAGPYTLAFGTAYDFLGSTNPGISTTNGTFNYYAFKWNEVTSTWQFLGATLYTDS